ncbi:hypothetical protein BDZ85DRAFT_285529 [Elsinoe ampelina]|uniref:Uncharacterized protein n=1 Tax=Elsinoe ampelina TaxID=302913 RepID=A0A6A6G1Q5_9PEZI|nr:hypothetical protein BDZ85DRAFT_285529 [Elsinoe ampelina]
MEEMEQKLAALEERLATQAQQHNRDSALMRGIYKQEVLSLKRTYDAEHGAAMQQWGIERQSAQHAREEDRAKYRRQLQEQVTVKNQIIRDMLVLLGHLTARMRISSSEPGDADLCTKITHEVEKVKKQLEDEEAKLASGPIAADPPSIDSHDSDQPKSSKSDQPDSRIPGQPEGSTSDQPERQKAKDTADSTSGINKDDGGKIFQPKRQAEDDSKTEPQKKKGRKGRKGRNKSGKYKRPARPAQSGNEEGGDAEKEDDLAWAYK